MAFEPNNIMIILSLNEKYLKIFFFNSSDFHSSQFSYTQYSLCSFSYTQVTAHLKLLFVLNDNLIFDVIKIGKFKRNHTSLCTL